MAYTLPNKWQSSINQSRREHAMFEYWLGSAEIRRENAHKCSTKYPRPTHRVTHGTIETWSLVAFSLPMAQELQLPSEIRAPVASAVNRGVC